MGRKIHLQLCREGNLHHFISGCVRNLKRNLKSSLLSGFSTIIISVSGLGLHLI